MATEESARYPFRACANCGNSFEPGVSYPVETREDANGELELYSFCDEDCRDAWETDG